MSSSTSSSYWCYRCNRFVRVENRESILCSDCYGGFVEEMDSPSPDSLSESRPRRLPTAAMYMIGNSDQSSGPRLRRSRRNGGDRSPFNPVIVLRGPADGGGGGGGDGDGVGERGGYELYYDDGGGSGLRPLPASVSDFLLGSGFDRLLDQLAQIEINGIGSRTEQPPASKAAIESMPTIEIVEAHMRTEAHCAVCKEPFELGAEAREMPCKHIYHPDCILPWLSLRNSCPVCRHELPAENTRALPESESSRGGQDNGRLGTVENEEETVGLTIWRLPGGGFAVGRFSGGRRGAERELPVVYTEMDGGFNSNQGGVPRRVSWGSRGGRSRQNSGVFRQVLRNLFACFGGGNHSSDSTSSSSDSRSNRASSSPSILGAVSRRRRRAFNVDNEI
ncbi:hypothetical protein Ancab_034369 [Ancistrocladus abbreviatus]